MASALVGRGELCRTQLREDDQHDHGHGLSEAQEIADPDRDRVHVAIPLMLTPGHAGGEDAECQISDDDDSPDKEGHHYAP
jgi:hypothetical protein